MGDIGMPYIDMRYVVMALRSFQGQCGSSTRSLQHWLVLIDSMWTPSLRYAPTHACTRTCTHERTHAHAQQWLGEVLPLDTPHKAYKALLNMYHQGQNPIKMVFQDIVMDHVAACKDIKLEDFSQAQLEKRAEIQRKAHTRTHKRTNAVVQLCMHAHR